MSKKFSQIVHLLLESLSKIDLSKKQDATLVNLASILTALLLVTLVQMPGVLTYLVIIGLIVSGCLINLYPFYKELTKSTKTEEKSIVCESPTNNVLSDYNPIQSANKNISPAKQASPSITSTEIPPEQNIPASDNTPEVEHYSSDLESAVNYEEREMTFDSKVPEEPSEVAHTPPEQTFPEGTTKLTVECFLGIGNEPYIRGNSHGLSLEKGQPMNFTEIGKWEWTLSNLSEPIQIEIYKNDEMRDKHSPVELKPNTHFVHKPNFGTSH